MATKNKLQLSEDEIDSLVEGNVLQAGLRILKEKIEEDPSLKQPLIDWINEI